MRLADIEPRADQPRKNFDPQALSALADSIAAHGLIQPIVVRPSAGGFYEIVAANVDGVQPRWPV